MLDEGYRKSCTSWSLHVSRASINLKGMSPATFCISHTYYPQDKTTARVYVDFMFKRACIYMYIQVNRVKMMTKFILRQHQNHFNNNNISVVYRCCRIRRGTPCAIDPSSDYSGRCAPKKTAMFAIHEDGSIWGRKSCS